LDSDEPGTLGLARLVKDRLGSPGLANIDLGDDATTYVTVRRQHTFRDALEAVYRREKAGILFCSTITCI
jgi:hypothetical protein